MRRVVLCNLSAFQRQRYPPHRPSASLFSYFSNAENNALNFKNFQCCHFTSTTPALQSQDDNNDPAKQHAMFQEQLRELSNERLTLFGSDSEDDANSNPLQQLSNEEEGNILSPSMDQQELEQLGKEREALFHFENEEIQAWTTEAIDEEGATTTHSKEFMEQIRMARSERDAALERQKAALVKSYAEYQKPTDTSNNEETKNDHNDSKSSPQSNFTHLSATSKPGGGGDSYNATMVDVGSKNSTHRTAVAQSIVVFPPEVMDEFQISDDTGKEEMVGPKGPIFETARLAGIMGAKKTQDLIPLCHPLPLNYVNITINLEGNKAIIECECRVTHKTGVEMEALTGASVAALTIYDMVKAVSHRVRIEDTTLISKSGGKRDVSPLPAS